MTFVALSATTLVLSPASCTSDPTEPESETMDRIQPLENGDVEIGNGWPDAWSASFARAHVLEWTDRTAAKGRRSLQIRSVTDGLAPSLANWWQAVLVTDPTDVTFVLSASVKLEGVSGGGVALALRGDDTTLAEDGGAEAFATTQFAQVLTGTRDWQRITVQLSNVPRNVNRLAVYLLFTSNSSGSAYFDDVRLSVVPR
jgi:hypothetical protein